MWNTNHSINIQLMLNFEKISSASNRITGHLSKLTFQLDLNFVSSQRCPSRRRISKILSGRTRGNHLLCRFLHYFSVQVYLLVRMYFVNSLQSSVDGRNEFRLISPDLRFRDVAPSNIIPESPECFYCLNVGIGQSHCSLF